MLAWRGVDPGAMRCSSPCPSQDHLDRAVTVYGDRIGVVDEPDQPAPSLGELTYRAGARAGRRAGRRARRARRRRRRAGGGRVAERGPAAGVVLRGVRVGTDPRAGQLPPEPSRRSTTSSSTRAPASCWIDPELEDTLGDLDVEHRFVFGRDDDDDLPRGCRTAAVGAGRVRDRDHQLHLGDDGAPQGRADDPPQHLDQRGDLRLARPASAIATSTCTPCRCSTPTGGACRSRSPAMGAPARRAAQDRRRRDPAARRASTASR